MPDLNTQYKVYCTIGDHMASELSIVATIIAELRTPMQQRYHCCYPCAMEHNYPGKFEQYAVNYNQHDSGAPSIENMASLGTALLLDNLVSNSQFDDIMFHDGWGMCARFENYLLFEDTNGFVTYEEFESIEAAAKEYDSYFSQGWGAQDDDAYIYEDRGYKPYGVSFAGKHVGNYSRLSRARAAISLEARKSGIYPSAWYQDDRGDLSPITYW